MRDIEGIAAAVRVRGLGVGHLLTAAGGNQEETNKSQLPPPEQPLLTRLSEAELAELIERHIEYIVETREGERSVHLAAPFVKHFWQRDDIGSQSPPASRRCQWCCPMVHSSLDAASIANAASSSASRQRHRPCCRLPPIVRRSAVAAAMRYLTDDWLVDVSTSYPGKCVLIALALTIIERLALAERPGFLVTAARRGGGKTTVLHMIAQGVLGHRTPAFAWSTSEEERRKALFAFLASALPLIAWDNIARGTAISCPSIEKALTAETYQDRILVNLNTVSSPLHDHGVYWQNIRARGDLASRVLEARLEVDRLDPENRAFRHPDPIAWTAANRGEILSALFTILLGNPRLSQKAPHQPKPASRSGGTSSAPPWNTQPIPSSIKTTTFSATPTQNVRLKPSRLKQCSVRPKPTKNKIIRSLSASRSSNKNGRKGVQPPISPSSSTAKSTSRTAPGTTWSKIPPEPPLKTPSKPPAANPSRSPPRTS